MKVMTLPCNRCGGLAANGSLCPSCSEEYGALALALKVTDKRVRYLVNNLGFRNLCAVLGKEAPFVEYLLLKNDWSAFEEKINKAYMDLRYEEIRRHDNGWDD